MLEPNLIIYCFSSPKGPRKNNDLLYPACGMQLEINQSISRLPHGSFLYSGRCDL